MYYFLFTKILQIVYHVIRDTCNYYPYNISLLKDWLIEIETTETNSHKSEIKIILLI